MSNLASILSATASNSTTTDTTNGDHDPPLPAVALATAFALGTIFLAVIFFRMSCRLSQLPKHLEPKDPTPIYINLVLQACLSHFSVVVTFCCCTHQVGGASMYIFHCGDLRAFAVWTDAIAGPSLRILRPGGVLQQ